MKKFALLSVVVTLAAIVVLYGLNTVPVVGVSDGTIGEASVKGLAYRNPELISGKDAPAMSAPAVIQTCEELAVKIEQKPVEESLIPLTKENVGKVSCILLGPFYEELLPNLRQPLEKNELIDQMIIESIPVQFSYGVFIGPYSTLNRAKAEVARLEKNGVKTLQIVQLGNRENVIKIREFNDMKEAEVWTREFVNQNEVKNVRLSRLNDSEKVRIRVVFPSVDVKGAEALRKMAIQQKIPSYVCPRN